EQIRIGAERALIRAAPSPVRAHDAHGRSSEDVALHASDRVVRSAIAPRRIRLRRDEGRRPRALLAQQLAAAADVRDAAGIKRRILRGKPLIELLLSFQEKLP